MEPSDKRFRHESFRELLRYCSGDIILSEEPPVQGDTPTLSTLPYYQSVGVGGRATVIFAKRWIVFEVNF